MTTMTCQPRHWARPVDNTSAGCNHYEWNRTSRSEALKHVTSDDRGPTPDEANLVFAEGS